MANSEIIRFENVTVTSGNNTLLNNVSFSMFKEDKIVLKGKSGAGKSTVLKTILGGYSLKYGSIFFNNLPIRASNIFEIRRKIAFVGQEPVLGAETVRDALLLPFKFKAHKHELPQNDHIFQILNSLNLSKDILSQFSAKISGGEKQRIVFGRALLLNKTIFFADEFTSALDPESKNLVMNLLSQPNFTVLSVSHDADWISLCNRIITLDNGNIMSNEINGSY
jgi:putative ABC transport system ATP-binding protein